MLMNMEENNGIASVPEISVIVCTYNRSDMIVECLQSLANQDLPGYLFEVIVVDNASSDQTVSVVQTFMAGQSVRSIRLLHEPTVGLSHARNLGVAHAQANFVAFIDDDARVPGHWLRTAREIILRENPDIFGGPAWPAFPKGRPAWFKDEYGVRGDMGASGVLKPGGFLIGTNIFFRRSLILGYGGFNPALGMTGNQISYHEETHLLNRARAEGKKIWYSGELAVKDCIPDYKLSLAFLIYSKYKAGKDIWKFQQDKVSFEPEEVIRYLDETFTLFNTALMERDQEKYPYPENYLYENASPHFYFLGRMVEFLFRKELSK